MLYAIPLLNVAAAQGAHVLYVQSQLLLRALAVAWCKPPQMACGLPFETFGCVGGGFFSCGWINVLLWWVAGGL